MLLLLLHESTLRVVFLLCEARNPFSSKLMLTKVCMYVYFIFNSNEMNSKSKLFFIQTHKIHEYILQCLRDWCWWEKLCTIYTDFVLKEPPPLVDAITESVDGWLLLKWHIHILLTHYCYVFVVYYWFLYNLFHFIIIQSADADYGSEFRSRVCGATLSKLAGQCQPHLQGLLLTILNHIHLCTNRSS